MDGRRVSKDARRSPRDVKGGRESSMDGAANKRTWMFGDLSIQDTRELRQMEQGKKEGEEEEEAVESVTESFNRQKIPAG